MRELREHRSLAFDDAFLAQMVKDHEAALRHARDTAKNARDPQLRAAAEKAVPEIRKHLQRAQLLQASVRNATAGETANAPAR